MKECDKKVWNNICRSRLNQDAPRPNILPFVEAIKIMVKQADLENRCILNNKGNPIASFQLSEIEIIYKFPKAKRNIDGDWYDSSSNKTNRLAIIKNWYSNCKRLRLSPMGVYKIVILRNPFQILMALFYRLYGMGDAIMFR